MAALSDILILVVPLLIAIIIYFQTYRGRAPPSSSSSANGQESSTHLSKLPIVTITANEILFPAKDSMQMDSGTKLSLQMLAKHACIFLFIEVKDQAEADSLVEPLAKEFEGIVAADHILFTQTELGRASMSRQLEPVAHFDYVPEVVHQTSIFFNTILIAPDNVESPHAKWRCSNFKDFMTNGTTEFFTSLHS